MAKADFNTSGSHSTVSGFLFFEIFYPSNLFHSIVAWQRINVCQRMICENTGWQATRKKDSDDKDFTGLFAVQRYHCPSLLALTPHRN